jgi:ketosteroid isomerase-like protein
VAEDADPLPGKRDGGDLDASFEHVNEMRDGKVVRFHNNVDREAWASGWGG